MKSKAFSNFEVFTKILVLNIIYLFLSNSPGFDSQCSWKKMFPEIFWRRLDLLTALQKVKWTEDWKCQLNSSNSGEWHTGTTKNYYLYGGIWSKLFPFRWSTAASTFKSIRTSSPCSSGTRPTPRSRRGFSGRTTMSRLPITGAGFESRSRGSPFRKCSSTSWRSRSTSPCPEEKSRTPGSPRMTLSGRSTSRRPWSCSCRPSWAANWKKTG